MKLPGMIDINYMDGGSCIIHYSHISLRKSLGKFYIETLSAGVEYAIFKVIASEFLDCDIEFNYEVTQEEYYRILNLFEGFEMTNQKPKTSENNIKGLQEIGRRILMTALDEETIKIKDKIFKIDILLTEIEEINSD